MGYNRPGKRRTERLKRAKKHQAQLARKAAAQQKNDVSAPATSAKS